MTLRKIYCASSTQTVENGWKTGRTWFTSVRLDINWFSPTLFFNSKTSRDTRATARVARFRRAVWPRLCRVSRLGRAWYSDFFLSTVKICKVFKA